MRGLWNDLSGAFGHAVSLRHKTKMRRASISDLARFQFGMLVRRKNKISLVYPYKCGCL